MLSKCAFAIATAAVYGAVAAPVTTGLATCPGRSFLNPVDSSDLGFGDYVSTYRCRRDSDCEALVAVVGHDSYCNDRGLCQAVHLQQTRTSCSSDSDCAAVGDDMYCSLLLRECQSINFLLKYRTVSPSTVIMPGKTQTVRFKVEDHEFAYVPNTFRLDLVFYGGQPSRTAVRSSSSPQDIPHIALPLVSSADNEVCAFPKNGDPRYPTDTYNPLYWRVQYPQVPNVEGDNAISGTWAFKIRNDNLYEPIVYVGGFLTTEVRYD